MAGMFVGRALNGFVCNLAAKLFILFQNVALIGRHKRSCLCI